MADESGRGPAGAATPAPMGAGRPSPAPGPESSIRMPDVIVDFEVRHDLLHVVLQNIGSGPAHRVRVAFEPEFHGVGGVVVPEIALFHRLEFLAPGRTLSALVDTVQAYFARGEPEVIAATATFHDDRGRAYRRRVRHDLGIFGDLPRAQRRG